MSLPKCPVQEVCIHFTTGTNKPPNHDVRDKVICKTYLKGCEYSMYVETQIMGLTVSCEIDKRKI